MNLFTETVPVFSNRARVVCKSLLQVVLGSFVLALCARVTIPMHPVPMTLQTLGVFLLGITLGGRLAGLAGLLYLIQATIGLPVLAAGVNPLWMFGPNAGYLLAMPLAAYLIGTMVKKNQNSSLWTMLSIFCGQLIIYTLGALLLSRIVGFKMAMMLGVLPFLPLAVLKLLLASSITRLYLRLKDHFG